MHAKSSIRGFTIIELMIVIAIIGILVSIAIPAYKKYTQKTRFSEVIMATSPYKTAVSLALQSGIPIADLSCGKHGIPEKQTNPTKNIESIDVAAGIITATSAKPAGSSTYILTPDDNGSHWNVSGTCLENGLCSSTA